MNKETKYVKQTNILKQPNKNKNIQTSFAYISCKPFGAVAYKISIVICCATRTSIQARFAKCDTCVDDCLNVSIKTHLQLYIIWYLNE